MFRHVLLIISMLVSTSAYAWDTQDTAWEAAFIASTIVDWGQTRDISKHPDQFYEQNPLLGEHPSIARVNNYFVGCIIGHAVVSYLLPGKYREWWQKTTVAGQVAVTLHNHEIGVKISF